MDKKIFAVKIIKDVDNEYIRGKIAGIFGVLCCENPENSVVILKSTHDEDGNKNFVIATKTTEERFRVAAWYISKSYPGYCKFLQQKQLIES